MRLGLHIPSFTWPGGPDEIGERLGDIAVTADEAGFDRISVMDHLLQISQQGTPDQPMLEAYATLGYLAAKTASAKLLALCTAVVYREPGLLAKAVTTLDIISGGRAMLGIGAAWNGDEAAALGLPFPPTAERFERLEEALQVCLQMWSDSDAPFEGEYYHLERTLNAPQSLTRPHPPILVGGTGERKTLRLVAMYADACNLTTGDLEHKLDVLRTHCEAVGRPYDEIEKTVFYEFDPGDDGAHCAKIVDELGALAELGITVAHGPVVNVSAVTPIEVIGELVLPEVASF